MAQMKNARLRTLTGGFFTATVVLCLSGPGCSGDAEPVVKAPPPVPGYVLAWDDDFESSRLDEKVWTYRQDTKPLSKQVRGNVSVGDGQLRIKLTQGDEKLGKPYAGGGVMSTKLFKYSYVEARLKLPTAAGWRAEFALRGKSDLLAQHVIIMERDTADKPRYGIATHDLSESPRRYSRGSKVSKKDFLSGFHTYGCEFTPEVVRYFYDGTLVGAANVTEIAVHGPTTVRLSAIASRRADAVVDDSKLPDEMVVDFVRVYELAPGQTSQPAGPADFVKFPQPLSLGVEDAKVWVWKPGSREGGLW